MKLRKSAILMAGWVLLAMASVGAEQPTKQAEGGGGVVVSEPAPQTLDFSFPGGTMAQFVTAVNKAVAAHWRDGEKPNLIVPAASSSVELPPMELRRVDLKTLVEAAGRLLPRGPVWVPVGKSTWVLQIMPDRRETRVFYVGHLLTKFKVDDISTALTTTWDMGGESKPDLKYHKDTQLLIVRADKAQLEVAQNVLAQLGQAWLLGPGADPANAPKGR
jgi:hypothetical protein